MKEKIINFIAENPRAKAVVIFAISILILYAVFG